MEVFEGSKMPGEVWDEVSDSQPNDSYRRVYIGDPEPHLPKTVAWLLANGAEKNDNQVLVSISW